MSNTRYPSHWHFFVVTLAVSCMLVGVSPVAYAKAGRTVSASGGPSGRRPFTHLVEAIRVPSSAGSMIRPRSTPTVNCARDKPSDERMCERRFEGILLFVASELSPRPRKDKRAGKRGQRRGKRNQTAPRRARRGGRKNRERLRDRIIGQLRSELEGDEQLREYVMRRYWHDIQVMQLVLSGRLQRTRTQQVFLRDRLSHGLVAKSKGSDVPPKRRSARTSQDIGREEIRRQIDDIRRETWPRKKKRYNQALVEVEAEIKTLARDHEDVEAINTVLEFLDTQLSTS